LVNLDAEENVPDDPKHEHVPITVFKQWLTDLVANIQWDPVFLKFNMQRYLVNMGSVVMVRYGAFLDNFKPKCYYRLRKVDTISPVHAEAITSLLVKKYYQFYFILVIYQNKMYRNQAGQWDTLKKEKSIDHSLLSTFIGFTWTQKEKVCSSFSSFLSLFFFLMDSLPSSG
jgi:hypothetical protein